MRPARPPLCALSASSRRARALAVVICGAAVAAACAGSNARGLDFDEAQAVQCVMATAGQKWSFAMDPLNNTSDKTVHLGSASLIGPDGLELHGAYASPWLNHTSLGVLPGWPPDGEENDPRWTEKTPLARATLAPHELNKQMLLVLIRVVHVPGSAKGVSVTYTVGGRTGTAETSIAIRAESQCS